IMKYLIAIFAFTLFLITSCSKKPIESKVDAENVFFFRTPDSLFENEHNYRLFEEARDYYAIGDYNKSLKVMLELERLEPNNGIVLDVLGTTYIGLKDYTSAEKYYRKALELNPDSYNSMFNLSTMYINQKDYRKAYEIIESLSDVERIEELDVLYYLQKAVILYYLKECENALKSCEIAMILTDKKEYIERAENY